MTENAETVRDQMLLAHRYKPFKVACEDRWGCGRVVRCAGYLSPPPTPWHAQPKCAVARSTLKTARAALAEARRAGREAQPERAPTRERHPRARCPVCDLPHVPADQSGTTWGPDCACQGAA